MCSAKCQVSSKEQSELRCEVRSVGTSNSVWNQAERYDPEGLRNPDGEWRPDNKC